MNEPLTTDSVPRWLHEAAEAPLVQKAKGTLLALGAFLRAPRAYAAAWAAGQKPNANPLFLMATSAALVTPLHQELDRFRGLPSGSLLESVVGGLAPYTYYAALGLTAHFVLWPFGALRPLRASLGVSILTGASAGALLTLATLASSGLMFLRMGTESFLAPEVPPAVAVAGMSVTFVGYALLILCLGLALAGAHGVSRARAVLAVGVAVIVCGRALSHLPFGLGIAHFAWTSSGFTITTYGFRF